MLKPRNRHCRFLLAAAIFVACCLRAAFNSIAGEALSTTPLPIPGGSAGIGFDDLGYSSELHKVIVPAGRTGAVVLIDPASKQTQAIGGFSSQKDFAGGHGEGVTSADAGRGAIFATDRDEKTLDLVDPGSKKILAKTKLAAGPDYVRYVGATNEVWVTEPSASQIEIFSLPEHGFPQPNHAAIIRIPNGPESLVIDNVRGHAYTNLWSGTTVAIDLHARTFAQIWPNRCRGSRGIAFDATRGFLLVACDEGKLESLSLDDRHGHRLGEAISGDGVDIIAYSDSLHHAYLPGGKSATMAVIGISSRGAATILATVPTAKGSHCVTTDDRNNVYICDPKKGRLLVFHDSLPAAPK